MFKFEKTFIINDVDGKLKVASPSDYTSDKAGTATSKFALKDVNGNKTVLYIDNLINFRAEDIACVHYTPAKKEQNESFKLTFDSALSIAAGDVVRLVVELGQKGRVIATFNDMYPDHSKFYYYEGTGANFNEAAAGIQKAIEHDVVMSDDRYVEMTMTGTDITINALDEYTIVKSVRLVKVGTDLKTNAGAVLTGYEDYEVLALYTRDAQMKNEAHTNVTVSNFNAAEVGVGTTNYLVQNVALLSDANINPYGLRVNDRPMPKSFYDQYHVELVTDRRYIGSQVVGALNQSLTEYTFFVRTTDSDCDVNPSEVFFKVMSELLDSKDAKILTHGYTKMDASEVACSEEQEAEFGKQPEEYTEE